MGLRAWLDMLGLCDGQAAAFDTRLPAHPLLTGRASKGIATMLHNHGFRLVAEPISFLVDRHDHLLADEEEQAERWGATLAAKMPSSQGALSGAWAVARGGATGLPAVLECC